MTPALELREAVKRFGDAPALGPVSLQVAPGERLALIGPSGSGKSTFFNQIGKYKAPGAPMRLSLTRATGGG